MNLVNIINIVPCYGKNKEGKTWKNTAIVYLEKFSDSTTCRIDKGVSELASEKIPSNPVVLFYDRYGRIVGWQSDQ